MEPGTLQGSATQVNKKLQHGRRAATMAPGTAAVSQAHKPLHPWGKFKLHLQAPVLPGNPMLRWTTLMIRWATAAVLQRDSNSVTPWGAHPVQTCQPGPAFVSLTAACDLEEEL